MATSFRLVLVETMGPANIGSVARSAAAFGLGSFSLVTPKCHLDEETKKWACYGNRLLDSVEFFDDLHAALENVDLAVALSRREGKSRHRHYTLPFLNQEILPKLAGDGTVALVFGNEESGLAKHHLDMCHCSVEIPVIAADGSLNLAHAVTVTLYELIGRGQVEAEKPQAKNIHEELAPPERLRDLVKKCEETLADVGYPRHRSTLPKELVKLQTIITRSKLENWEVRLLLGMIKQVQYTLQNPPAES